MPSSAFNLIREIKRQAASGDPKDDKFLKSYLYFFELRLPRGSVDVQGEPIFFFPLVLNPTSITMTEPFALESTMTQGAGLYIEEHGIITRSLRIRGNTGFKPRKMASQPTQLSSNKVRKKSYGRSLPYVVADAISGMRHLQYLQDAVFRTYGDFKRDPATSKGTELIWHNPKEDERWLVAPRNFSVDRSAQRENIYSYDIDLLVLDTATAPKFSESEDKNFLDRLKNALATIQEGVNVATGALQDITALAGELKGLIKDMAKIIDSVTGIISAAQSLLDGVTSAILAPLAAVYSVAELIDQSLSFLDNLEKTGQKIKSVPDSIKQAFRQLGDSMDLIGMHPEAFETPLGNKIRTRGMPSAKNPDALSANVGQLSTLQGVASLGTGALLGDVTRALSDAPDPRDGIAFTGAQVHQVALGDTLTNLAARYLGDARLWQYIAVLNGLKPPFLTALAAKHLTDGNVLSGVVNVGDSLLIPNFSSPPAAQPLLPVLGVRPDASPEEQFLGTDLLLAPVSAAAGSEQTRANLPQSVDLAIDREKGSTDVKTVSGAGNITQAMLTRMLTERGTDTLYQSLGTARLIGLGLTEVDYETARFRLQESLTADPRIADVTQLKITSTGQGDAIDVEATLALRGFTNASTVRVRA